MKVSPPTCSCVIESNQLFASFSIPITVIIISRLPPAIEKRGRERG